MCVYWKFQRVSTCPTSRATTTCPPTKQSTSNIRNVSPNRKTKRHFCLNFIENTLLHTTYHRQPPNHSMTTTPPCHGTLLKVFRLSIRCFLSIPSRPRRRCSKSNFTHRNQIKGIFKIVILFIGSWRGELRFFFVNLNLFNLLATIQWASKRESYIALHTAKI